VRVQAGKRLPLVRLGLALVPGGQGQGKRKEIEK